MFFFVGGVQPRLVVLEEGRRCPSCGGTSARLQRADSYLSLFFVPLLRLKEGDAYLACPRCGYAGPPQEKAAGMRPGEEEGWLQARLEGREEEPESCPRCGQPLQAGFRYCPHCGRRLR